GRSVQGQVPPITRRGVIDFGSHRHPVSQGPIDNYLAHASGAETPPNGALLREIHYNSTASCDDALAVSCGVTAMGRRTTKRVPLEVLDSHQIAPPWASTM